MLRRIILRIVLNDSEALERVFQAMFKPLLPWTEAGLLL
jgi:hypothetical protein